MDNLLRLIIIIALIAAIYAFRSRTATPRAVGPIPFRKRDYLLTEAERAFYEVLCRSVDRDTVVFPKVRLVDLLWLPGGTPNKQALLNRVISKHVDFVLCRGPLLRPSMVVELDDSSHRQERRRERDETVDTILGHAGLPMLRIPVRQTYSAQELGEMIRLRQDSPSEGLPTVEVRRMDGSDEIRA